MIGSILSLTDRAIRCASDRIPPNSSSSHHMEATSLAQQTGETAATAKTAPFSFVAKRTRRGEALGDVVDVVVDDDDDDDDDGVVVAVVEDGDGDVGGVLVSIVLTGVVIELIIVDDILDDKASVVLFWIMLE